MATLKIKKGDTVKVIAGKDVGAEGKVLSVDKKSGRLFGAQEFTGLSLDEAVKKAETVVSPY